MYLFIRNLKYAHLTPILRCIKINNHLICFERRQIIYYTQNEFLALNIYSLFKRSDTKIHINMTKWVAGNSTTGRKTLSALMSVCCHHMT